MKLYFAKGACSLAPHIMLEELGLQYEAIPVDFANRPADLANINPLANVPTLIMNNGDALTENAVILQYLADQKPEANFAPRAGTMERVRLQESLNFIATEIHKGLGFFFGIKSITEDAHFQEELKAYATKNVARKFHALTSRMGNKPYVAGMTFSVADAYLYTVLTWAPNVGVDLKPWPTLGAFFERIRARPAVQRAMKAEGLL